MKTKNYLPFYLFNEYLPSLLSVPISVPGVADTVQYKIWSFP